jgi:hypothetical protein
MRIHRAARGISIITLGFVSMQCHSAPPPDAMHDGFNDGARPSAPAAAAPAGFLPEGGEETAPVRIPVRAALARGDVPGTGYGAYGYLVFPYRPGPETFQRYTRVCQSYFRSFESLGDYADVDHGRLMVTYWLLAQPVLDVSVCDALIERYDYAKAKEIASAVQMLPATGPILVAWRSPYTSAAPRSDALVFDMSSFSNEDLDRAFSLWNARIASNPAVWHRGFKVEKAREGLRNFVETYGAGIIRVALPKFAPNPTPEKS